VRIVMIGQRGVPATVGGIEHHVEEIGARLAAAGHEVEVHCRPRYAPGGPDHHRGMAVRRLPTVPTKHLEAGLHSALATVDALRRDADVVHVHALGPGVFTPVTRLLSSATVVQTIHGLDDERAKWGAGARAALGAGRWISTRVPDAVIAVSRDLADRYRRLVGPGGPMVVHVPNGVRPPGAPDPEVLARWGLERHRYLLFVGRLVPEKAVTELLRAHRHVPGEHRLVVVGGSAHTDAYAAELERLAHFDRRVVMAGPVVGDDLQALYADALGFVLPSHLEGLPLTLLEACAHGLPVVASALPPHREILGTDDTGAPGARLHRPGDEAALASAMVQLVDDAGAERAAAAERAATVRARYDWDAVATETLAVYEAARRRRATTTGRPVARAGPAPPARRAAASR
jgi:glycosyltransferase involved in cell wall biosynthesis